MIGVILNPNARGARHPSVAQRLRRALDAGGGEVAVTRTPDELRRAVTRFVERGCDPVGICGGDGTSLSTITQLIELLGEERLPRLAILRGGTVNTVAANLGIAGRPDQILERLARTLSGGGAVREVEQDLLRVNGMYGFLFASAMGARFLEAYYGAPMQGVPAATALALRTACSSLVQGSYARWLFQPTDLELDLDGERTDVTRARLLLASTVPNVGIGMRVTWQAGREPGRFHVIASSLSTTAMALQVHRVLLGRPLSGFPHLDRLARSMEIRFRAPHSYTLDGELFRERRVVIGMGPRVRLLVA